VTEPSFTIVSENVFTYLLHRCSGFRPAQCTAISSQTN